MAGTQQGLLTETNGVTVREQDRRYTLPESTMLIVGSSGVLWVLLFGLVNFLLG